MFTNLQSLGVVGMRRLDASIILLSTVIMNDSGIIDIGVDDTKPVFIKLCTSVSETETESENYVICNVVVGIYSYGKHSY